MVEPKSPPPAGCDPNPVPKPDAGLGACRQRHDLFGPADASAHSDRYASLQTFTSLVPDVLKTGDNAQSQHHECFNARADLTPKAVLPPKAPPGLAPKAGVDVAPKAGVAAAPACARASDSEHGSTEALLGIHSRCRFNGADCHDEHH